MKHALLLTGLCIIGLSLIAPPSSLWAQATALNMQLKQKELEGVWTQVCYEIDGEVMSSLPGSGHPNFPGAAATVPYLWKISKDYIELGPDNHLFPNSRFSYELSPDRKIGAMDLVAIGQDGQKIGQGKLRALYSMQDDYMIVCWNRDARPENFTTSKKAKGWLFILRRGKLAP